MGPPPFSGGNHDDGTVSRPRSTKLQWGRRLSAAEIRTLPAHEKEELLLQWGRRLSAAEIDLGRGKRVVVPGASMGPPPFSGGNAMELRGDRRRRGEASMGPPPFSGGNALNEPRETKRAWASMGPPPFSGGNATRRGNRPSCRGCFNGAAAFQRRKWHALQGVASLLFTYTVSSGCCPGAILCVLHRGVATQIITGKCVASASDPRGSRATGPLEWQIGEKEGRSGQSHFRGHVERGERKSGQSPGCLTTQSQPHGGATPHADHPRTRRTHRRGHPPDPG